jgi:branched-chain amino acid transport system ATP-binding protein
VISGLLKAKAGEVNFNGNPIIGLSPHKIVEAGLIQVPEGRKIFPRLTVQENLRLGSYVKKAKLRRTESMDWVLNMFPILRNRNRQLAGTLSGGEQQMLAIGRGLMSQPEMLMLDEPSLGLAPLIVRDILETVIKINAKGTTILMIEQNTFHALKCCKRAYVMENGKIIMEGKSDELLNNSQIIETYLGL